VSQCGGDAGALAGDPVPDDLELLLPGAEVTLRDRARALGLGRHPLCRPQGSGPRIGGFVGPLCWRCSGVLAGAVAAETAWRLAAGEAPLGPLVIASGLLALPAVADVAAQEISSYTSNPRTRFSTGVLLGAAACAASQWMALLVAPLRSW
jgi:uncharacterized membrane protein